MPLAPPRRIVPATGSLRGNQTRCRLPVSSVSFFTRFLTLLPFNQYQVRICKTGDSVLPNSSETVGCINIEGAKSPLTFSNFITLNYTHSWNTRYSAQRLNLIAPGRIVDEGGPR